MNAYHIITEDFSTGRRLQEPKHKLQQLRLFFSHRCWSAPAMRLHQFDFLISFSTFVPHQYSNVVGCSLSIAGGANYTFSYSFFTLCETHDCVKDITMWAQKHKPAVNGCVLFLFMFWTECRFGNDDQSCATCTFLFRFIRHFLNLYFFN